MVKKLLFGLVLFISFNNLFAQEIKVTASTDSTDYMIGDKINYTLFIQMDKSVDLINPFFRDSLKNVDVLNMIGPQLEEHETGKSVKYICVLSRYDSAEVTIPPIKIEYRTKGDTTLKSVLSDSVSFKVHRMNVSVQEEIKDIKPPIKLFDFFFVIYILIGLGVLSILFYYFIYRKYFRKKQEVAVKQKEEKLLSHQLALRKLEQLDKEQLWQKGFVKDYHSRITDIIREYFEKQFGLPALERTTTESLNLLKKHPQGIKVVAVTEEFLNNADLVKFAKYQPLESVNHEMMEQAKNIVYKTAQLDKQEQEAEVANAQ